MSESEFHRHLFPFQHSYSSLITASQYPTPYSSHLHALLAPMQHLLYFQNNLSIAPLVPQFQFLSHLSRFLCQQAQFLESHMDSLQMKQNHPLYTRRRTLHLQRPSIPLPHDQHPVLEVAATEPFLVRPACSRIPHQRLPSPYPGSAHPHHLATTELSLLISPVSVVQYHHRFPLRSPLHAPQYCLKEHPNLRTVQFVSPPTHCLQCPPVVPSLPNTPREAV